jgi:VanZ family protein
MRTEEKASSPARYWTLGCAAVLVAQVLSLAALPFELLEPGDKVVHALAYAALTLMLWIATDGRRPQLVPAGVMLLALAAEAAQSAVPARSADAFDFLAGAAAAAATAALLYWKSGDTRPCAESSGR